MLVGVCVGVCVEVGVDEFPEVGVLVGVLVIVSNASAKPFNPYAPAATAPATFAVLEVAVPDGVVKLTMDPVVNDPVTPASFASGHPSPSLSKSK